MLACSLHPTTVTPLRSFCYFNPPTAAVRNSRAPRLNTSRLHRKSLSNMGTTHAAIPTIENTHQRVIPPLVSVDWLHQRLGNENLKVLDGSWYLPVMERDALEEFRRERIPGAAYFDVDGIADLESSFLHMLPSPAGFAAAANALGITKDSMVVVYDGKGVFSSPRVWWTFKVFGYDNVAVLDGGLPAWNAKNYEIERSEVNDLTIIAPVEAMKHDSTKFEQCTYISVDEIYDLSAMKALVSSDETTDEQIIDARPAPRFQGAAPEPRPSLIRGHMPGSINVPFSEILTEDGYVKPHEDIRHIFSDAGVDFDKKLVATCGSGLTACIIAFALELLGKKEVAVYDGSWMEWGSRDDTKIV